MDFVIESEVPSVEKQSYHFAKNVNVKEERVVVTTRYGDVHVVREGDPSKRCILTLHDIGLNQTTDGNCFESFIHQEDAWKIFQHFHLLHFNIPGHEEGAKILHNQSITISSIIEQIEEVLRHFNIKLIFCIGVGFGATVLTHYGLKHPGQMLGLVSIGPLPSNVSWLEWCHNKFLLNGLYYVGMKPMILDQFIQRMFSEASLEKSPDLKDLYCNDFQKIPPENVYKLLHASHNRPKANFKKADFDIIIFLGRTSNLCDYGYDYYSELNPARCELVEFMEGSHLLTVQSPQVLIRPLRLFLQGQGLV